VIPLKNSAVHFPAAFFAAMLFASPTTWAQAHSDFLGSLINQKMILLHIGSQQKVKVRQNAIQKVSGTCDMAVELKWAEWHHGTARFWFHNISRPYFSGTVHRSNSVKAPSCGGYHDQVELEISGFAHDESAQAVEAALRQVLLTPEQYLAANGIPFDLPAGPDDEAVTKCVPPVVMPRLLLNVEPDYSDQARKAKYNGTVQVGVIVGSDGRIHKAHITRSLGMGLDEKTLEILPLWRFQPATLNGKPVACAMGIEVSFTLF
jgi:TonB family protein